MGANPTVVVDNGPHINIWPDRAMTWLRAKEFPPSCNPATVMLEDRLLSRSDEIDARFTGRGSAKCSF